MKMTEEQMRNRMKEIDEELNRIRSERKKYEDYFADKKQKEKLNNHKKDIGKCYKTKNLPNNAHQHIKAFKILQVHNAPNENSAICSALIDGYNGTCWTEYGIQTRTIRVWGHNEIRLMPKESDPNVIDFYEEITQEEFETLYREYLNNIEDNIYK